MSKKIREQVLSLGSYLLKVKDDDISDNQDVQRMFCWDNAAINELVCTVLTNDYIPPIILGEEELGEGLVQQYIVDGMQRSSALIKFRYGNYKITSSIENSIIKYQVKRHDEKGKVARDEDGSILWDNHEFNIKNKTFEMLPKELQKRFDEYQIRIAIHQRVNMDEISRLVRRYNLHRSMSVSQKALTWIPAYSRKIKNISNCGFFKNCTDFKEGERKKGTYEMKVSNSVMSVFHLDKWKKQSKATNVFLNKESNDKEFATIQEYADRIESVCSDKFKDIFVLKDIEVWFAVFNNFNNIGLEDSKFADFVQALKTELHSKEVNGDTYDSLDKETGTKDKKVIVRKINLLTALMNEYLDIDMEEKEQSVVDFIKENVNEGVTEEDVDFYKEVLDDLTLNVDNDTKLLDENNLKSLLGIISYSFVKDIDLDKWLPQFFEKNSVYNINQKENYLYMKNDLELFLEG